MSDTTLPLRLAYADPPYPGKAHLYTENTEVDHVELIQRLGEYDGWALSTDERSLRCILGICPKGVRVLAWCRSNTPNFLPFPYAAWEPVICSPARTNVDAVPSFFVCGTPFETRLPGALTGQKPRGFCEWVLRALGAKPGDELDDLFPGSGVMGATWSSMQLQPSLFTIPPSSKPRKRYAERARSRTMEPLPGLESHHKWPRLDENRKSYCGNDGVFCSVGCQVRGSHRDEARSDPWVKRV